jgi:methionyl-tRNA formyltransferase
MTKKIILFGCQAISIDILRFLINQKDIEVSKVISYEVVSDISRGQESIISVARELGIQVEQPRKITSNIVNEIRNINPDLIISAYYRKIFPKELIDIPRLGIVNIHPSLLPFYRGPVPTAWAILNNESEFGITLHKVDAGIDTGDILFQSKHEIDPDESGYDLYLRAMQLGSDLFINNFNDIISNKVQPKKQPNGGSYYGKLSSRIIIDWRQPAQMIKNNVRVRAHPYIPIETILESKYFFINKVSIVQDKNFSVQMPGRIIKTYDDDTFLVSCSDGIIHVKEYEVFPPFSGVEKEIYLKPGRSFNN